MPFGGLLSAGLIAGGSIFSGILGSNAAKDASKAQVAEEDKALQFAQQQYSDQKGNQAPYLAAGQSSLSQIMAAINNGTFGPGSVPQPGAFHAPTLEEARNDPGYKFAAQQGSKGILQGASAAGGAISGGTLKALAGYNANLADSTYGNVFNRNLATYNTGLTDYQAKLAGQAQAYNQLSSVAGLGQVATQSIGQTGTATSSQIANIDAGIGNAQASGIVGSANALGAGVSGAFGAISSGLTKAFPGGVYSSKGGG